MNTDKHLRGHHLKLLGHLHQMNPESLTRQVQVQEKIVVQNMRRERPQKTWKETVKGNMKRRNFLSGYAQDRDKGRHYCRQLVKLDDL